MIILALQVTACRPVLIRNRPLKYLSCLSLLKERQRRNSNQKNKAPESKVSEWILRLTHLF